MIKVPRARSIARGFAKAFGIRTVRHLLILNLIAAALMAYQYATFPLIAVNLSGSLVLIGVLGAVVPISRLLIALPFGFVADRFGSGRVVILGMACFLPAYLLVAIAPTAGLLALSRVAFGFASVGTITMGVALLAEVTRASERGSALGLYLTASSVGLMVGSPLGPAIVTMTGYHAAYWIGSGLALVSTAYGWLAVGRYRQGRSSDASSIASIPTFDVLRNRDVLVTVISNLAFVAAIPGAAAYYLPVYVHAIGLPPIAVGAMLAWRALFSALGRIPVGALTEMLPLRGIIAATLTLEAGVAIGISVSRSFFALAAILVVDGLLWGTYLTVSQALIAERVEGRARTSAMALYQIGGSLGEIAATLGLGAVAQVFGLSAVYMADGLFVAAMVPITLLASRGGRTGSNLLTTAAAQD